MHYSLETIVIFLLFYIFWLYFYFFVSYFLVVIYLFIFTFSWIDTYYGKVIIRLKFSFDLKSFYRPWMWLFGMNPKTKNQSFELVYIKFKL